MSRFPAVNLWAVALGLAGVVIGFQITLLGFMILLVFLFTLIVGLNAFRVVTVAQADNDSLAIVRRILRGEDGEWLSRLPWAGLLFGSVLRSGYDLILALGEA